MGAWIETEATAYGYGDVVVAPRVVAWIETSMERLYMVNKRVAPRMGAWIETVCHLTLYLIRIVAPRVGGALLCLVLTLPLANEVKKEQMAAQKEK